jgi:phenylalanine-4-hydroxylase
MVTLLSPLKSPLYTERENALWGHLYERQVERLKGCVIEDFFGYLEKLNVPKYRVPLISEVSEVLGKLTGWSLAAVSGFVSYDKVFSLLANKRSVLVFEGCIA